MKKVLAAIFISAIFLLSRMAVCQSLDDKLIRAVKSGDSAAVQTLLQQGASIEAKDFFGTTPLHYAAFYEHVEVVKQLLDKGANIEAKDSGGNTPLLFTIDGGIAPVEVVKVLLDHGANIEAANKLGWTPLIMAAHYGDIDVVKLLLNKGANADARNNDGDTALTIANKEKKTEIVKLLQPAASEKAIRQVQAMNLPPDVPAEARNHMARGIAAVEGAKTPEDFKAACDEFLQVVVLAPWLPNGYRNLAIAQDKAGMYDEAMANLRLYLMTKPSSADVEWAEDMKSKIGYRQDKVGMGQKLVYALSYGHIDKQQARALIDQGVDVNAKNSKGQPVLCLAAGNGLTDIVSLLLDKGADIEGKTSGGGTALMCAASGDSPDTVRVLMNRGANMNARGNHGETDLMDLSCGSFFMGPPPNRLTIIRMLVEGGADVNARNNDGKSVLTLAESDYCRRDPELIQTLRALGAK